MNKTIIRIISGFLCAFIFAAVLPNMPAFAAESDVTEEKMLLEAIGVLDTEAEENSVVTRAELIKSVIKLRKADSKITASAPAFTDLSESHWAYDEIMTAYQLGYIEADKQGKIYPDSPANGSFALKVLVDALCYKAIATNYGGNDSAYFKAAGVIGLTDKISVSLSAPIERDDYVRLLYNALIVPLSESVVENGTPGFQAESKRNLLNSVYNIYRTTGVVTANKYITLGVNPYDGDKDFIIIDNAKYYTQSIDTNELLGCNVKLYYEIDDDDVKTVVCVLPKNNTVVTLGNSNIKYSDFKITAVERGLEKEKKYSIDIRTSIIWNYKLIGETEFAAKVPGLSGEMKLVDNDSNGIYDTVIVEEQKVIEVYGYSADAKIISGANKGEKYELEKYTNVMYQSFDKTLSSPLILQNAKYVSVFATDGDYRNIAIRECKPDIQTTVNGISASDGTIDLENYGTLYLSKKMMMSASEIEVGQEYIFSFDCYGDIIYASTLNTGSNNLVYLIDKKLDTGFGGFEILVMDLQGKTEVYKCAKNVSVRERSGTVNPYTQKDLNTLLSTRQPMIIRLNNNREVTRIFQLADPQRDDLFFHEIDYFEGFPETERNKLEYQRSKLAFSNAIMLRSNAVKMFAVPHKEKTDCATEDFKVITQANFRSGKSYDIGQTAFRATAICMEADDFICDYMVWEYADSMNKLDSMTLSYGAVEKAARAVNSKTGETGWQIKVGEKEYWLREQTDVNGNKIETGSVIAFTSDYSGSPTNSSIKVLCDLNTGKIYTQGSMGNYTKNDRFRVGKAELIGKSGGVGRFRVTRDGAGTTIVQCYNISGKNVYVYDANTKKFKQESAVSYLQKGNNVILGISADSLANIYMIKQ